MRLLVCGGRDFDDYERVKQALQRLTPEVVITGGARGADHHARVAAQALGIRFRIYEADWDTFNKAAGPIRNQRMLDEGKPDLVLAFPGGAGTADMVRRSKKAGVKVIEAKRR